MEKRGPFRVQLGGVWQSCPDTHFVNLANTSQSDISEDAYVCNGAEMVIGSRMCDIFSSSTECRDLRHNYKRFQNYLSFINKVTRKSFTTYSYEALKECADKIEKSRVGGEDCLDALFNINMESESRFEHRKKCTCVADLDHLKRIKVLDELCSKLAEKIKAIAPVKPASDAKVIKIPWSDFCHVYFSLNQLGSMLKVCKDPRIEKGLHSARQAFTSYELALAKDKRLLAGGKMWFTGYDDFGWLTDYWNSHGTGTGVEDQILGTVVKLLIEAETYDGGRSCVKEKHGVPVDVRIDGEELATYLQMKTGWFVTQEFLDNHLEKNGLTPYSKCITKYDFEKPGKIKVLCEKLQKLKPAARKVLEPFCTSSKFVANSNIPMSVISLSYAALASADRKVPRSSNISENIKKLTISQTNQLAEIVEEQLEIFYRTKRQRMSLQK